MRPVSRRDTPSRHARKTQNLDVCDAITQTAKHFERNPSQGKDPITAKVVELYSDATGQHADVEWSSAAGRNGCKDALELADLCIDEWQKFFRDKGLDPDA
jgi:hypothetical protein